MHSAAPESPGLIRRILRSPPARIIVLGFLMVYLMAMNGDSMTSYGSEPIKALAHIVAIAIAGFAVYIGYARFIEQRDASEMALPGMGRELGIGMLVGFGLYYATMLFVLAFAGYVRQQAHWFKAKLEMSAIRSWTTAVVMLAMTAVLLVIFTAIVVLSI